MEYERNVRKLAGEAKQLYSVAAQALVEFRSLFPFPQGGNPNDPETAERAIKLLRHAQESETQGVKVLERLLNFMKDYHSEKWIK